MGERSQAAAIDQAASFDTVAALLTEIRDLLAVGTRLAELLTRDDMAALLNVGVSTFDRLKAAGRIGPMSLELAGVKYSAAEVKAWLATRDGRGELYDADCWGPIWKQLQSRGNRGV